MKPFLLIYFSLGTDKGQGNFHKLAIIEFVQTNIRKSTDGLYNLLIDNTVGVLFVGY